MQASIFLARLRGPLLFVPGIGLLINPRVFRTFGLTDRAAGLAIVLARNLWVASRRVLITLMGWLMLIRGAARVLASDRVMGYAAKIIRSRQLYPVAGAVRIVLGRVLSATWPDLLKGAKQ